MVDSTRWCKASNATWKSKDTVGTHTLNDKLKTDWTAFLYTIPFSDTPIVYSAFYSDVWWAIHMGFKKPLQKLVFFYKLPFVASS